MKTAHQLAKALLAGPDKPIVIGYRSVVDGANYPVISYNSGLDVMDGGDSNTFIELHAEGESAALGGKIGMVY